MKDSEADLENKFLPKGLNSLQKKRPKKELSDRTVVTFVVFGLLLALGFLGVLTYYSSSGPRVSQKNLAIDYAQRAVRQNFGPGIVLTFSGPEWTHLDVLPGNKYYVSGWVNAATERRRVAYTYTCTLASSGNSWTVESLSVLPQ